MNINNKFKIGQFVYLKTDPEQKVGIVTSIIISFNGLLYDISFGMDVSRNYEIEISTEKNILMTIL